MQIFLQKTCKIIFGNKISLKRFFSLSIQKIFIITSLLVHLCGGNKINFHYRLLWTVSYYSSDIEKFTTTIKCYIRWSVNGTTFHTLLVKSKKSSTNAIWYHCMYIVFRRKGIVYQNKISNKHTYCIKHNEILEVSCIRIYTSNKTSTCTILIIYFYKQINK